MNKDDTKTIQDANLRIETESPDRGVAGAG